MELVDKKVPKSDPPSTRSLIASSRRVFLGAKRGAGGGVPWARLPLREDQFFSLLFCPRTNRTEVQDLANDMSNNPMTDLYAVAGELFVFKSVATEVN